MPGFICIAALATMLSAYSGASSSEGNSPVQPVKFRHTIHVDTLKMNCLYCHFSANKSFDPGLPAVGTCMGCHTVIAGSVRWQQGGDQEARRVLGQEAAGAVDPHPQASRVRPLPAHASRERGRDLPDVSRPDPEHEAGLPGASLNMGWCVNCHIGQSNPPFRARYDCSSCHY